MRTALLGGKGGELDTGVGGQWSKMPRRRGGSVNIKLVICNDHLL